MNMTNFLAVTLRETGVLLVSMRKKILRGNKMRATGIVRKVDYLGRVVIPKEMRRTMKLKEGDLLEVFVEGDLVCFKKYEEEEGIDDEEEM